MIQSFIPNCKPDSNMKRGYKYCMLYPVFLLLLAACHLPDSFDMAERDRLFNDGWKFTRDSIPAGPRSLILMTPNG